MLRRVTGSKPPRAYFVPLTATPHNPAATTSATAGRRSHGTGDGTAMRNTTTPPIARWIDATVSRVVLSPNRERAPMFQARLPRFAGSRRSPSWTVKAAVELPARASWPAVTPAWLTAQAHTVALLRGWTP